MPECPYCTQTFETRDQLVDHLSDEGVYEDVTLGVIGHANP